MKRIFFVICISLITCSLYAQPGFGLKAGANLSNLKFSNKTYTTSSILGAHAGIFYNHGLGDKAALQGEIVFSTEGNKWKTNTTTGKVKESQVRVPVLFQYSFSENMYAEAGPQYSLLLSIKQSVNGGSYNDIKEFYKTGTFGYVFGAGYKFNGSLCGLRAGLRYNGDFSKINSANVGGNDLKNSLIQLTFMYTLSKK